MADSDGDYQADDASEDEFGDHQVSSGTPLDARSRSDKSKKSGRKGGKAAWGRPPTVSGDAVVEDADGTLAGAIEGLAEAQKRARLLKDTTPLQRGIIRHLVLVLDMSFAMLEKDLLPSRHQLTMAYASEFVREYFEQNPISQLAVIGMRDGIAVRISDMSGNPGDHLEKLQGWVKQDPQGNPSLQNALEMCRGALFHTPTHGTREVLIVYGALMSSDPGDINDTLHSLIKDRIRVSIVGLAAQVAICEELCSKTNGGDTSGYNIAGDNAAGHTHERAEQCQPANDGIPVAHTGRARDHQLLRLPPQADPAKATAARGAAPASVGYRRSVPGVGSRSSSPHTWQGRTTTYSHCGTGSR
ncbi:hypothetical protein NUW58_g10480 [Xylaria curta]|uniref:Uncharacterized protein n=1 Tax=Xylaria curta TaxID=42375 RepID=A0ACC1MLB8_9PEZI|nr:hypothetical protein NUW58_g10480 [Xylaria curta]